MKLPIERAVALGVAAAVAAGLLFALPAMDAGQAMAQAREKTVQLPAAQDAASFQDDRPLASVVFAGGCFWGVQGVFQHVNGVRSAVSGYIGGDAASAHYAQVSSGRTAHAEAVQVQYDPRQVSYGQLLQVFFSVAHDPTQRDRQGPDHGRQYRSAVFADDPRQQQATRAYISQIQPLFPSPVVTELGSGQRFYRAERYHQDYMRLNPQAAYIRYYDAPKLAALQRQFPQLYRAQPVRTP